MRRQLQGIALILFSLVLSVSFEFMGIRSVFDLSISWQPIFLILALVGMVSADSFMRQGETLDRCVQIHCCPRVQSHDGGN